MNLLQRLLLAAAIVSATTSAWAIDVTVKGVHLCCGSCVSAVEESLQGVEGIAQAEIDSKTKTVSFRARDEKTMKAALAAMAAAGFHGTATADRKPVAYPAAAIRKGTKSSSVTLTGLHLCCGSCKTGLQKALKKVEAIKEIHIDQEARTVTVTGADLDVQAVVDAVYKDGFHGEVKP